MADIKENYPVGNGETYESQVPRSGSVAAMEAERELVDRKGSVLGEAAVMYGDTDTAEKYGYVQRGLKSRHVQFIALGGTIGTGLFLGIGNALAAYGPLSIFLGYTITGVFIYCMMQCLGEVVTWLPLPGAVPQICARYVEPACGFAVGWNTWYSYSLTLCSEISAASVLVGFWNTSINPAAWVSIIIPIIICLNIFAVAIYGEAEFIFASIKIVTIVGLLLFALIIDCGAGPSGAIGFRYWHNPGSMEETVASGSAGRFLSFWSTMVNAAFSYGGVEMIAVAAGEAENPRKNIPKAVRRTFWRILFFYVLGSLGVGLLVPYNDPQLSNGTGARASPWVIAVQQASVSGLPSVINAVILTSATSSANAFLYTGSRYLFALAQNRQAPRFFLKCSKRGVPYYCVAVSATISLLTYMSSGVNGGAEQVFAWFLNLTTIANIFTWLSIAVASLRFTAALKAQGVSRDSLPFKAPLQPYLAWATIVFFSLVVIFSGWFVFTNGNWNTSTFFTYYIGVVIYFGFYAFWKILKRQPMPPASEVDLWTGKAAIDAEIWPESHPTTLIGKFWAWLV